MDKRLVKRHKRQVTRARERVKVSEPDVRTPEEVAKAREASQAVVSRRTAPREPYAAPPASHSGEGS
jgi:hypothetical protein